MTYYWRKTLLGGYGYTIDNGKTTFVSKPFKTPLEALQSFKRQIKEL